MKTILVDLCENQDISFKLKIQSDKIFCLVISPSWAGPRKSEFSHGLVFLSPARPIRSSDAEQLYLKFEPQHVMSDFEMVVIKAVKQKVGLLYIPV